MKNFIFKSTAADLQKMFQYLETLQKNVLYLTHRIDYMNRSINKILLDKDLQKQTDRYFDETSHQTDLIQDGPTESSD